jgi:hypothetical protein
MHFQACGMVSHTHLECDTDEHEESKLKWEELLKANRETWHGRSAMGGAQGYRGGTGSDMDGRGMQDAGGYGRAGMNPFFLVVVMDLNPLLAL